MRHKINHIHFVGIGGSGMSGIAEVLLNLGYAVSGSDLHGNASTARLKMLGATVNIGHQAENISGADVVVVSTAVKEDNPEVVAARQKRIPVVPRAVMLAELMRLKKGIAVAGTHGKTTTTSLVSSVLAEGGIDPTFVIGGKLNSAGSNAKLGSGEFIVVEADESDASFLHLQPVIAVVTNIDADHMETYGHDFSKLRQTFADFVEHLPFYGVAVLCADDPSVMEMSKSITKTITTYGISEEAQIRAFDIEHCGGKMKFRVKRNGHSFPVTLNLPGLHNVRNALAAVAVGVELNISDDAIAKALSEFKGVGRRFQNYGEIPIKGGSYTLIDDYGHHPAEMAATIAASRGAFPGKRIVLAFQPHRYTRTRDLFEDFVKVLASVDVLFLTEVYAAGESPIVAADGRSLARSVRLQGLVDPIFVETPEEIVGMLDNVVQDGDVVLVMGAGSIGGIPRQIAEGRI
jgi:UDP-N-acetylmuramate--alanine ligase